jgi:hypothetical protein
MGALVFNAVIASTHKGPGSQLAAGDTIVFLGPVPVAQPVDGRSRW